MTHEQLEQEHRRLVIKMHPDRNPNDPEATAKFQEMQQQYEERKAELNGDYTKSARGRERRERERREREERERKERERNRLAEVLEQARRNKQKRPGELKAGDNVFWWNQYTANRDGSTPCTYIDFHRFEVEPKPNGTMLIIR
jgi:curved DNA-binding protein CbpA